MMDVRDIQATLETFKDTVGADFKCKVGLHTPTEDIVLALNSKFGESNIGDDVIAMTAVNKCRSELTLQLMGMVVAYTVSLSVRIKGEWKHFTT